MTALLPAYLCVSPWSVFCDRSPAGSPQATEPRLTAKTNCRYEVEWVTEYACHRDYLESHSCSLTSGQHDIAIDLSPLTLSSECRRRVPIPEPL